VQPIFVVQGKTEIGQVMRSFLAQANYPVRLFTCARDVIGEADRHCPALIFVEIGAGATNDTDLYGRIRTTPSLTGIPVILFSSATGDEDRILALECGADDYIGQPFTRRELIARVQAVLRRFTQPSLDAATLPGSRRLPSYSEGFPPELITMGDIQIDTSSMKVSVRGTEVTTTTLEFRLIYYLAKQQHRVFTRDQLLDAVWGTQFATPRSVDACIGRIRRKIEPDRNRPRYLKTVRGAGYLLNVTTAARHYASPNRDSAARSEIPTLSPAAFTSSAFRSPTQQSVDRVSNKIANPVVGDERSPQTAIGEYRSGIQFPAPR
jgi:DNA-binding response OmpR family regulator